MHAVRQTRAGKHLAQLVRFNMPQAHRIFWATPPTTKRRMLPTKTRALARSIAILVGKAEGAGRQTVAVQPRDTSQTCVCGEPVPKDLSERWHHCPRCGLSLPRDQVSAMLIKARGLEMLANKSGLGSSPQAPTWPAGACVA
jgi:hypothetical protein